MKTGSGSETLVKSTCILHAFPDHEIGTCFPKINLCVGRPAAQSDGGPGRVCPLRLPHLHLPHHRKVFPNVKSTETGLLGLYRKWKN